MVVCGTLAASAHTGLVCVCEQQAARVHAHSGAYLPPLEWKCQVAFTCYKRDASSWLMASTFMAGCACLVQPPLVRGPNLQISLLGTKV